MTEKKVSTNKLTDKYECSLDIVSINIAEMMLPTAVSYKWLTPNIVTFCSFASRIISFNLLVNGYGMLFLLFFHLSYIFDCLDGKLARKLLQLDKTFISNMGDFYDHTSDIVSTLFGFLIFIELSNQTIYGKLIISCLFIIAIFLMCLHLGAQEKYMRIMGEKTSDILYLLQYTCSAETPEKIKEHLRITRYFGCGNVNMFISILLYLFF